MLRCIAVAKASKPERTKSTDKCMCSRDTIMFGMGTKRNPLVFQDISMNDVRIVYDPNVEVVYRNVVFTNVQEEITGSNVTMHSCRRNYSGNTPFGDTTSKTITIEKFGSEKFPLVFCDETFVRATVDCNNLHVWFINCTFIECFFAEADHVKQIDCKHRSVPFEHEDPLRYQFFVRIDETRCIWGHVVFADRVDPPLPQVPQPQLSPTQEVIQRWKSNLLERVEQGRKSLEKSKSGRRLLQLTQRRSSSSTALSPSVQGPYPSTNPHAPLQPQQPVSAFQPQPQAQAQAPMQPLPEPVQWPYPQTQSL